LSGYLSSPWEEVEVTLLDHLQAANVSFKTPKKLKLGAVLVPEVLSVPRRPKSTSLTTVNPLDINDGEAEENTKIQQALLESTEHNVSDDLRTWSSIHPD
jgi:hypothetical protein